MDSGGLGAWQVIYLLSSDVRPDERLGGVALQVIYGLSIEVEDVQKIVQEFEREILCLVLLVHI